MNVIFIPKVLEYLDDLVTILYIEEYFCFLETSKKYVEELIDNILTTLPKRMHRQAPKHFDKYGNMQLFQKTDVQHGMCFLKYTIRMAKKSILYATLPIIILSHNICDTGYKAVREKR